MSSRWLLLAAVLGQLVRGGPAEGGTLRATLGLEYDDNPFEYAQSRRAGWVSRLYLYSTSSLLERGWGNLLLRHQWGVKRFWRSEEASESAGDVVANHLELGGKMRLHERLALVWGGEFKLKNVQRITSEESYLRGGLNLGLAGQWRWGLAGRLNYRRSDDDARDLRLVDVSLHQLGVELIWAPSRRLSGQLGLRKRWLDYDRRALVNGEEGQLRESEVDQEDRGTEWSAGVQYYRGVLLQARYALTDNHSNSAGFGYDAQRIQLMLARHLLRGIDVQLFLTTQLRSYDRGFAESLPGTGGEQDEYEQSLVSVKLARRLGERYDLSWQYRYSRNGSRLDHDFFRKNVYSFAIDMVI